MAEQPLTRSCCVVWGLCQVEVDAIVDERGLLDLLSQIDQLVARSSGLIDDNTSAAHHPISHVRFLPLLAALTHGVAPRFVLAVAVR